MWRDLIAPITALLGIGVTANLFSRRATRRNLALRSQSELWAMLPNGPGRTALRSYLNESAQAYVKDLQKARADWTTRMFAFADTVFLPAGTLIIVGYVLQLFQTDVLELIGLLTIAAAICALAVALLLVLVAALVRLGRWGGNL